MFIAAIKFIYHSVYYIVSFIYTFILFLHAVLPIGIDVGILGVTAYFITRLKKADPINVEQIFGPDPWSKESELHPEKVVKCIAHRGASLDAPENTMQAFKYVSCLFTHLIITTLTVGDL